MESIFKRAGDALGIGKRAAPTQTIGTTRTSGSVATGEGAGTFDEPDRLVNLIGPRRFDEFDRLVRDVSIIGAGVRLFLNLISNAVWTVNPPEGLNQNEEAVAQGYADQVYAMLFDMTNSWAAVVRKTAAFKLYGFTIQEWTAKQLPDGSIGLLDIEHRPQKTIQRWNRDIGGTVQSVVQRVPGRHDVELPRSKIIYAVDDTLTDSPEGIGLFRHLATTASRLEMFLSLEEIGFTTDLRGIPVARAPLGELRQEVIDAGPEGSPPAKPPNREGVGHAATSRHRLVGQPINSVLGTLPPCQVGQISATIAAEEYAVACGANLRNRNSARGAGTASGRVGITHVEVQRWCRVEQR